MAKILVMGAGAIGGYYGMRLAEAGNDVYLVARGKHLEVLQKDGLLVESVFGRFQRTFSSSDDARSFGIEPEYVFFGVKSFDTKGAISQIEPVVGKNTQILAMQNGVENYEHLVEAFGKERVIRGFCRVGAELVAPGRVSQVSFGEVYFGEDDGSRTARLIRLAEIFEKSGVEVVLPADIRREVWIKFVWNSVYNVLTGLLRKTIEELYRDATTEALMRRLGYEIVRLGAVKGVNIADADIDRIVESGKKLGPFRTSTYQDREKGKRLEFDAFTGAIVRMGEKHGISTPEFRTIDALYRAL